MGLIKTGLKAAVFVKTAHVVHDRIERRQQAQWAAQGNPAGAPAGPAPAYGAPTAMAPAGAPTGNAPVASPTVQPPAAAAGPSTLDQLTQLGELRANGVLTEDEFQAQKARILAG